MLLTVFTFSTFSFTLSRYIFIVSLIYFAFSLFWFSVEPFGLHWSFISFYWLLFIRIFSTDCIVVYLFLHFASTFSFRFRYDTALDVPCYIQAAAIYSKAWDIPSNAWASLLQEHFIIYRLNAMLGIRYFFLFFLFAILFGVSFFRDFIGFTFSRYYLLAVKITEGCQCSILIIIYFDSFLDLQHLFGFSRRFQESTNDTVYIQIMGALALELLDHAYRR